MLIYLYLRDKCLKFKIPSNVIGSYTFDEFDDEDDKLINIEARNNQWVLYSTKNSQIVNGQNIISETVLKNDSFYVLKRNNINYLMYVTNMFNDNYQLYNYNENINMIIGNANDCNVIYANGILNNKKITIKFNNNNLVIQKTDNIIVYINDVAMKQQMEVVNVGDKIEIYGLKLYMLQNTILINNPSGRVKINLDSSKISLVNAPQLDLPKEFEIKETELYNKNDYYLKSPRIRRNIETKDIKIAQPPKTENEKDLPLILTIGPMFTMGIVTFITLFSAVSKIMVGETTWKEQLTPIITSAAMLISMLIWPMITKFYGDMSKKANLKKNIKKYNGYLDEKRKVLEQEEKLQREILNENLISVESCVNIIENKSINFWDKRIDQSDFLNFRIGKGDQPLDIKLDYQEDDFSIEHNKLKEKIDDLLYEFKYIRNIPIGYSFKTNNITAILGNRDKCMNFVDNILLQLLTFYTYEDIKLVLFTNSFRQERWNYIKYLNHNFNNERNFRFFASDYDSAKNVTDYLNFELNNRKNNATDNKDEIHKPHYFIIVDGYDQVKRFEFIKELTELDKDFGFSLIIIEEKMGNLPSKCSNFISIGQKNSGVLQNSYEKQEQISFTDEINSTIDMMKIAKQLSNIPIEFEDGIKQLPESISFLEMEKVGKVEQLNILNRWNQNDATTSLKAEVGVDENNELIYLDLHEKFHGPHGLIAGTTGSGKSEFIITYILSLAMNYSPDDVSFILIDYKGGGLAFAFENKTTGMSLPHLAGTITNLDKAEMDRTLVSIDSEIKRRQTLFNEARDKLGESTIDIYKYQRFYKEGRLDVAIPHLFIICDEFAELKTQQPDFMDNLISVARIGRSLGVHLILATQKPSGVVNDQIWSNTKFRVCLKVQDEADSNEMLKRPEAAGIKETGRFFLQVGYDELFILGQSGWCGAKYYPSDKIVRQVDKSINFINDCGSIVKSIQAGGNNMQSQGEQLPAIVNNIIELSNLTNKRCKRLWLENIPEIILVDSLEKKYNITYEHYSPTAILGEYDAPEKQEQGIVSYNFVDQGNSIIYGFDGSEREMLLDSIIYSSSKNFTTDELNFYIVDYGSESLRKYAKLPHLGGLVFASEEDKYNNLFKLIKEELQNRKRLFADYNGEYRNYVEKSDKKLPVYVVILNNWDSIYENDQDIYDELPDLLRDSERYGIVFILTASAINSIPSKISQACNSTYCLRLKDASDYSSAFGKATKLLPRSMSGRGIVDVDGIHEFQTSSIVNDSNELNKYLDEFIKEQKEKNPNSIHKIPTLPDIVRYSDIQDYVFGLKNVPIGIEKNELNICSVDYTQNVGNIITSNKLSNAKKLVKSLVMLF